MANTEGQTYCLRWNNHKSNLVEILDALIKMESYVDCTIVVDDQVQFKAHRVVLAANSPYFQSILQDVPMDHCSILFPGVQAFEMRALLEYMYTGEVNVTQSQIPKIMKIAEQLEVKGLFDMTDLKEKFNKLEEQQHQSSNNSSTSSNHHYSTHNTSTPIFPCINNNNTNSKDTMNNENHHHHHHHHYRQPSTPTTSGEQPPQQHHHHIQQSQQSQQQSTSPVITTSSTNNVTTAAQSSSSSPPYAYKSPYSSLYTKSPGPSTSDRQHWPSVSPIMPPIPTTAAAAAMLSSVYENAPDMNPLKRKKLSSISSMLMSRDTPILRNVLAQSHAADSSQPMPLVCQQPSVKQERTDNKERSGPATSDYSNERKFKNNDEAHSPYTDKSFEDDGMDCEPKYLGNDSRSFSHQSSSQKPEWKRYKQYTRSDILAAIECVRNGMSALQASRKFGVPSRTLYDKVKKLGITTGRPMNRTIKRSPSTGSNQAGFPFGLSGTSNPYGQSEALLSQMHEANEHHHHLHRDKEREHHLPANITHPAAAALLDPSFLQQAFESRGGDIAGREALHAMALAAAAHAAVNGISTSPGTNGTARSPSPGGFGIKYSRSQNSPPTPSALQQQSSHRGDRDRNRDYNDRDIEDRDDFPGRDDDDELERQHKRDIADDDEDDDDDDAPINDRHRHNDRNEIEEDENHVEDLSVSRKDHPSISPERPVSCTPPPQMPPASSNHHYGGTAGSQIHQSAGVIVPPMTTKLSSNGDGIDVKRELLTDDSRD